MNTKLVKHVWSELLTLWETKTEDVVDSKDIYDNLLRRGVKIPNGAMKEVFSYLRRRGYIRYLEPMVDTEETDGAVLVSWINSNVAASKI